MNRRIFASGIVFVSILLFSPSKANAGLIDFSSSKKTVGQGEIVIIQKNGGDPNKAFKILFLKEEYSSFLFKKKQTVVLPIPYDLLPGKYWVTGSYETSPGYFISIGARKIKVIEKYPKHFYLPPKRAKERQEKVNRQSAQKQEALRVPSQYKLKLKSFLRPIKGIKRAQITSPFGVKRCRRINKNQKSCRYHPGTDYQAAFDEERSRPEPVRAINDGQVIYAEKHIVEGWVVVIDHGNGIFSESFHLSRVFVAPGNLVARGQKIGIAGASGESAHGIHLHLTIKFFGKYLIDPESLFKSLGE